MCGIHPIYSRAPICLQSADVSPAPENCDAAKVCDGLSHQFAHAITFALARLGVIKIVRKGQARLDGGQAAEFRYPRARAWKSPDGNGSSRCARAHDGLAPRPADGLNLF